MTQVSLNLNNDEKGPEYTYEFRISATEVK